MDVAFHWVKLLEECSDKLNKLADEMEETQKGVNVTKVVGSSVSVAGAATATAAGVATLLTGGAALPVIAVAAGVASWLGLANNAVADVVSAVASGSALKEAGEVVKKIEDLHEEIEELVKKLKEEAQKKGEYEGSCDDDYVTESILRAMAKRVGLIVDDHASLKKILEEDFNEAVKTAIWSALIKSIQITAILIAQSVGGKLATKLTAKLAKEAARRAGGKTAAKAAGRMVGGALGLVISIPELVDNCKSLSDSETEASKNLRQNAKTIKEESEEMKKDLDAIENLFRGVAEVKRCTGNTQRSECEKKALIESAVKQSGNEFLQQWLKENAESEGVSKLVDVMKFL